MEDKIEFGEGESMADILMKDNGIQPTQKQIDKFYCVNDSPKIVVYAIAEHGEGRVQQVGVYESIEEIELLVGMFAKDVLLKFEYESSLRSK